MAGETRGTLRFAADSADALRGELKAGLYAVVDSCDEPAVPAWAKDAGPERCVSLYRGDPEEEHWDIAPYLFKLDEPLLARILGHLKDRPWGLFAACKGTLEEMRRHWRRFLLVKSPQGEEWVFRFYDPRVLEVFLPTCREEEARSFFGPCRWLALTVPGTDALARIEPAKPAPPGQLPTASASKQQLLAIRPEQMEAFQVLAERMFARRVAAFLRDDHADLVEGLDDEELLRRTTLGLARAKRHGMAWERTQVVFVTWMFRFAPDFDEYPKFKAILAAKEKVPDAKIDKILEAATDADWAEAQRVSRPDAWGK